MKASRAIKAAPCITGALLSGFMGVNGASAQGFSLNASVSETLDFTGNAALEAVSAGSTLTSSTSVALSLLSETNVSSFGIDASSFLYLARNPDGSFSHQLGYPSLTLTFADSTEGSAFTFGASYRVAPAGDGSTFLIDDENDDGVIDPGEITFLVTDARQITLGLNASYSMDLTARDTLRLSARFTNITFDGNDPDLIASQRQSLRANWNHQINDGLSGGVALSAAHFQNEDVVATTSMTTALSGDISYQVSELMNIGASLGVTHSDVDDISGNSITNSFSGSADVSYSLADGTIAASFDYGVRPTDGGQLAQTASLGLNFSKSISNTSNIGLTARYEASSALDGSLGSGDRRFSFSPTYSHELGRDLNANVGYRFQHTSGGTDATSHGIFVGLTKNFQLLQ